MFTEVSFLQSVPFRVNIRLWIMEILSLCLNRQNYQNLFESFILTWTSQHSETSKHLAYLWPLTPQHRFKFGVRITESNQGEVPTSALVMCATSNCTGLFWCGVNCVIVRLYSLLHGCNLQIPRRMWVCRNAYLTFSNNGGQIHKKSSE